MPKILAMIPYITKDYGLEVARDPARRTYLLTDPASTTAAIASGVADITVLFTTAKIYKEYFDCAELYVANSGAPARVKLVRNRDVLSMARSTDGNFVPAWWNGDTMEFRDLNGATGALTDTLQVRASRQPASDLSDLPDQLHEDFIIYLAARAAAELGRAQPAAQ